MKQFKYLLTFCGIISLSLAACHDHEHEDDTTNPVINITAPAPNASLTGAVTITGNITDNDLHEFTIRVNRKSDNAELFTKKASIHGETDHDFSEIWTPGSGITTETEVTVTVEAEDHNDNKSEAAVGFKIKS
jgi:Bacterial Ig domain